MQPRELHRPHPRHRTELLDPRKPPTLPMRHDAGCDDGTDSWKPLQLLDRRPIQIERSDWYRVAVTRVSIAEVTAVTTKLYNVVFGCREGGGPQPELERPLRGERDRGEKQDHARSALHGRRRRSGHGGLIGHPRSRVARP